MRTSRVFFITALVSMAANPAWAASDSASGEGGLKLFSEDGKSLTDARFKPKHAYAYTTGDGEAKRTVVVLTEAASPAAAWNEAGDRPQAIAAWCGAKHGSYVMVEVKPSGEADSMELCGSGGSRSMEGVSVMNGLPSLVVKLEVNDGKRVKGTIQTGSGACSEGDQPPKYCEVTANYQFDASLSPSPLADRVWADGNAKAPELAAARKALEAYWQAAGKATKISDLSPHFTTERNAQVAQQEKDAGPMLERLFKNAFLPAHASPLTVVEGRYLAGAAVLSTSNDVTRRDQTRKQTCRTLMKNESGAWKVDKESCKASL